MDYLELLNTRYSVKKFNKNQSVDSVILHRILEAGKLAASSLGLQPYRIIVVESAEMKEKLIPAFYNPSQISTCSHLLIIVSNNNINEDYIGHYFRHISSTREISLENLNPFRENINKHINQLSAEEIMTWSEKQSYIVLGNLMFAAALEKIDSCPMEGFNQQKIDEILELKTNSEKVSVTLALGFRAEDDFFQTMKKVRKPDEKLFKFI